jgi:hypothetical protein
VQKLIHLQGLLPPALKLGVTDMHSQLDAVEGEGLEKNGK